MIVTSINAEFLPALRALHNSMLRHSPETPLACLTYGTDDLAAEVEGMGIEVHHNLTIGPHLPAGEDTAAGCHPMYARLLVPMLYDDCLWLDADQLVMTDLSPLLALQFGQPVAAVADDHRAQRSVIGLEIADTAALMSGLLVFNTKVWRARKLTEQCLELMTLPQVTFRFVVQSVLNVVLKGEFCELDPSWQGFANRRSTNPARYRVLHWHGRTRKPWTHPEMENAALWRQYA